MYFSGRLPRPPWETRSRVEAMIKRLDRGVIQNYGDRFRFTTLSRGLRRSSICGIAACARAKKGGRAVRAAHAAEVKKAPAKAEDKVLFVASFKDPKEMDKLHDLYDTLRDAREQRGEQNIPFHKFTELVKAQVSKLKKDGAPEVAFRVSVKDGKLNFTARGLKGAK